jgi:hypothetical protein
MRLLCTLVAAGIAVAAPANAPAAANLAVDPPKACYRSGETLTLLGTGYSPSGSVDVTRDGAAVGPLDADGSGAFEAELTLGLGGGRRTRTYTATDRSDPALTASAVILVTAVDVRLRPLDGAPGRMLSVAARGFKPGGMLWAHVRRQGGGGGVKNLRIGRPRGDCGTLRTRRRLLPANAPDGRYRIQFDDHRAFRRERQFTDVYTVEVKRP